jgi:hypothetical protein
VTVVAAATGWAWWWIPATVSGIGLVALLITATVRVARRYYNGGTAAEEMAGVWNKVKTIAGFPVEVVKDAGHLVAEGSRKTISTAKKVGGWIAYPFKKVGSWAKSTWTWARENPEPHQASDIDAVMSSLEKAVGMGYRGDILPGQA